jgi:hypothetical protein
VPPKTWRTRRSVRTEGVSALSYSYTLNCGQYVGNRDGHPVTAPMDEVAIALDAVEGFLHKHGDPVMVRQWVANCQRRLSEASAGELASQIVVISGRFALDDLNRCLTTSGYAGLLYERALQGHAPWLELDGSTTAAAKGAPDVGGRLAARVDRAKE